MSSNTERAVAALFTDRPSSREDLALRLSKLSKKHVCRLLVDRLLAPELSEPDLDLVRDCLGELGIAPEASRIVALALDASRPVERRGVAYLLVSSTSPADLADLEAKLGKSGVREVQDVAMMHDLRRTRADPTRAELISAVLLAAEDQPSFTTLLARIEVLRARLGLPAALAYGDAIYHMELPLERVDTLVALVEAEDCYETVDTLAQVVVMADEVPARDRVRGPWMRARARRAKKLGGEAWVSDPDGEGAIAVFGWFEDEVPPGGVAKHTLAEVTIGDRGILSVRLEPWADPEFVHSFLDGIADETGVDFHEESLEAAAKMVAEGAARGHTPEHEPALKLFAVHGGGA